MLQPLWAQLAKATFPAKRCSLCAREGPTQTTRGASSGLSSFLHRQLGLLSTPLAFRTRAQSWGDSAFVMHSGYLKHLPGSPND